MFAPRPTCLVAVLLAGCHVYDPGLLDASHDVVHPSDGAPDGDGAMHSDGGDVPDGGRSPCDALIARGVPCIEAFSGHAWSAEDSRLLAPAPIALVGAGNATSLLVGDPGTARVVSYGSDPHTGRRLAGTGASGIPVADGDARSTALTTPSALLALPDGDVLLGDSTAHALYTWRSSTARLERFGHLFYETGPFALAQSAADVVLVAADNQIFAVTVTDGAPTTAVPVIGQACGNACRGFNPTPTGGTDTLLSQPTGVDYDANAIYVADSGNCRIRRATRSGMPAHLTTVLAGAGCDSTGDILAGNASSIDAASAHLGPVGDVRVGSDGTVYFTDPSAHCAILAVATSGSTAGQLRVFLGSSQRCGVAGPGGIALGRLGGLALSADRGTLYFTDSQNQRVGRVPLGADQPVVTWVADAGPIPGTTEAASGVRVGGASGVAVDPARGMIYWAGLAEGRVYQAPRADAFVGVLAGNGHRPLSMPLASDQLEPGGVVGMHYANGVLYLGLREHSLVADADGTSLFPLAGTFDVPGDPALGTTGAGSDHLRSPGWPVAGSDALYFSADTRVFRLAGAMPSSPMTVVAGLAADADAGPPPVDGGHANATSVALGQPQGLALDGAGGLFVADTADSVVWHVRPDGSIEIAAGLYGSRFGYTDADSDARTVAVPTPTALAYDGAHTLYIADADLLRIRALDTSTARLVTVAGSGPVAPSGATDTGDGADARTATLGRPTSLAWAGDRLYIGMANTGRVRVFRPAVTP